MATATSSLIVQLIDQISGPAGKAGRALNGFEKELTDIQNKARRMDAFRQASKELDAASVAFKRAKDAAGRLKNELAGTEAPTKKMERALQAAERQIERTKAAFMTQGRAVRTLSQELGAAGTPVNKLAQAERNLKAQVDATTAAMQKQAAVEEHRLRMANALAGPKAMAAGAAVYAGYKGKEFAGKAIVSAAEFDRGVRNQVAYTDVSEADQKGLLIPQAMRIGQETPFTNLDVVKAQTAAMQGLPAGFSSRLKAEVAEGILENVKNYAMLMEADLKTSAEAVRAYLQATNKDISTKEKALAEANKATNQLVKMAKLGGMSDEDVQGYLKYAAASGTAGGLSSDTMMTLAALGRRAGLRGDETGVFVRSAAAKLVAPTQKGMTSLATAGIDFNKYTTMPGGLSVDNFGTKFKQDFGKDLTKGQREKLSGIMEDDEIVMSREKFTAEVMKVVQGSFTNKKGKLSAEDARTLSKKIGEFHKLSVESVDTEGLLQAILNSNMGLALLNAFFTDKHGGKASILQNQFAEFLAARAEIAKAGDDPNYAKNKSDYVMAGLGGALENLKGSVENLTLSMGRANEGVLKFGMDMLGSGLDQVSNLSEPAKQTLTAAGIAGAGGAALWGAKGLVGLVTAGPALTGSAAALDGSAVALTRAAVALGAGGAAPDLPGGKTAGSAKGFLPTVGGVGAAIVMAAPSIYAGSMAVASNNAPPAQIADTKRRELQGQLDEVEKKLNELRASGRSAGYIDTNSRPLMARKGQIEGSMKTLEAELKAAAEAAGAAAALSVGDGLRSMSSEAIGEGHTLMGQLRAVFGEGVNVPVSFQAPPGAPASVPAAPSAPAVPGRQTSVSPTINIHVNGAGDPAKVASLVAQRQKQATDAALRGAYSDIG